MMTERLSEPVKAVLIQALREADAEFVEVVKALRRAEARYERHKKRHAALKEAARLLREAEELRDEVD